MKTDLKVTTPAPIPNLFPQATIQPSLIPTTGFPPVPLMSSQPILTLQANAFPVAPLVTTPATAMFTNP